VLGAYRSAWVSLTDGVFGPPRPATPQSQVAGVAVDVQKAKWLDVAEKKANDKKDAEQK